MTRKDYELIAAALRKSSPRFRAGIVDTARHAAHCAQWQCDANMLANALAGDNPRFDLRRFLIACGVET